MSNNLVSFLHLPVARISRICQKRKIDHRLITLIHTNKRGQAFCPFSYSKNHQARSHRIQSTAMSYLVLKMSSYDFHYIKTRNSTRLITSYQHTLLQTIIKFNLHYSKKPVFCKPDRFSIDFISKLTIFKNNLSFKSSCHLRLNSFLFH